MTAWQSKSRSWSASCAHTCAAISVYCNRIAHWKYWRLCRPERKTKWPSSSAPVLRKSERRSSLIWGAHAAGVLFSAARRKFSGNAHAIPKLKERELIPVLCKNHSTSRRMEHASGVRSPEADIVRENGASRASRRYPEVSYAVCEVSSTAAITSISTLAPFGSAETWTVERAGGFCLKYDP